MDAVITNKKIFNILIGRQVNSENNTDTVLYSDKDNVLYIDSIFTIMDQYLSMDIYKLTGISYTEYKQMTPLEKNIFLDNMNFKISVSNYDYEVEKKNMEEEDNTTLTNNDALFGMGG